MRNLDKECTCPLPYPGGEARRYCNVERLHWGYCVPHQLKWLIGSNIFSGWLDEAKADWERNEQYLSLFRELSPDECFSVPDNLIRQIDQLEATT